MNIARLLIVLALGLTVAASQTWAQQAKSLSFYVGTYTNTKSKGIYQIKLNLADGTLSEPELAGEGANPAFLAVHPNGRNLYAVNEVSGPSGRSGSAVCAYSIDPATGKLTLLNKQPSGGRGPCYVALDAGAKNAFAANYGSGSVSAIPVKADGSLAEPTCAIQHQGRGTNPRRQEGPHAHCIDADPTGKLMLACDLGLDKVMVYRLDADKGLLTASDPAAINIPAGSGPRHLTFHPNGKYLYVINEMACTISAFAYDPAKATFADLQTISTLPTDFKGNNTCAEIQIHPSGKFLYGSNRGHDTIAIFSVDPATGKLTAIGHQPTQGKNPRYFGIDPTGSYLLAANQDGDSIVAFKIDQENGSLKPTGAVATVAKPVCIKFRAQ